MCIAPPNVFIPPKNFLMQCQRINPSFVAVNEKGK